MTDEQKRKTINWSAVAATGLAGLAVGFVADIDDMRMTSRDAKRHIADMQTLSSTIHQHDVRIDRVENRLDAHYQHINFRLDDLQNGIRRIENRVGAGSK